MLSIAVGAPVILLCNLSKVSVNGLRGYIHKLESDGPTVYFQGKILKLSHFNFTEKNALRKQFPIKLAYALTVHQAQGQTLSDVVVDCSDFFAPSQLEVPVGRVKMSGLQVINYKPQLGKMRHSDSVYEFYINYRDCHSFCCRRTPVKSQLSAFPSPEEDQIPPPETEHVAGTSTDESYEEPSTPDIPNVKVILETIKIKQGSAELTPKQKLYNDAVTSIKATDHPAVQRMIDSFHASLPNNLQDLKGKDPNVQTNFYKRLHIFLTDKGFLNHIRAVFNKDNTGQDC